MKKDREMDCVLGVQVAVGTHELVKGQAMQEVDIVLFKRLLLINALHFRLESGESKCTVEIV